MTASTFKGFTPAPSNTPGFPTNPATLATYDFDTELSEEYTAQIEGLTQRTALELTSVAGTANDVTATTVLATNNPPGIQTLVGGMLFWFKPVLANDGDVTMQIDGMAAPVDVLANDGTATAAGYFQVGSTYLLKYDSTLGALVNTDVGSSVLAGNRAPDDVFECQRAAGTADGDSTTAAQERFLNTAVRNTGGVILDTSTGRFTLPAGKRQVRWSVPVYGSGLFTSELYDLTNAASVKTGTAEGSGTTIMPRSEGVAYLDLASATVYVIRTKATSAVTDGKGKASNLGLTEVYTRVEITQIDETNDDFIGTPGGPITLSYEFDTAVTAPPGTSRVTFDNTSFASAAHCYLSQTDGSTEAADIGPILDYLQAGTSTKKALMRVSLVSDDTQWALFDVGSLADSGLYYTLGVTKIAGTVDVFDDAAQLLVQFGKVGDAGTTGAMTTIVAATALAADQNDYTVGAAGRQVITVLTDANADRAITGLVAKSLGEEVLIVNIDTALNITLSNENAGSAAANRFYFGADVVIPPKGSAVIWHDETLNGWRLKGKPNVTETASLDATEVSANSATTLDLGALASSFVRVDLSVTPITSFGSSASKSKWVRWNGTIGLTYSTALALIGAIDRTVYAGDISFFKSDSSGNWREYSYRTASGQTFVAVTTPAQITADQNDYAPTNYATAEILRVSSDAARVITGYSGTRPDGFHSRFVNVGSFPITLSNESTSSTAANRFTSNYDIILRPAQSADFRYDTTTSRWRLVSHTTGIVGGTITPTQITSNQNNYAPTGYDTAQTLRLSTDAARTITGFAAGTENLEQVFHNVGSFAITLSNESGSSTAANRFSIVADYILQAGHSVRIKYDSTSARWRIVAQGTHANGVDVQDFIANGTWTKPAGAKWVDVVLVGAGGGGASGPKRASGVASTGGSGGGGGAAVLGRFNASDLGTTETVTVGAAGTGAAAVTADSTNGASGTSGGDSSFGTWLKAYGGGGGQTGATSDRVGGGGGGNAGAGAAGASGGAAGIGGSGAGGNGGNVGLGATGVATEMGGGGGGGCTIATSVGAAGGDSIFAGGGGGGGGGITAANAVAAAGAGGGVQVYSTGGGGAAGTAGSAGTAGATNAVNKKAYAGAGGGGGSGSTSTNAGAGGAGGVPGGGGGGGAASQNGASKNSGAGGDGGRGEVKVVTYF